MNLLNLLVLNLEAEHELEADHAIAVVSVQASALFSGRAALREAKEVAQLVSRLGEAGFAESALTLEHAQAGVESGVLSKSSSATYRLAVRCEPVEKLSAVLGVIASAKQAQLLNVRWGFDQLARARREWMEELARDGVERARGTGRALGVEVKGVHRFVEAGAASSESPPGGAPSPRFRSAPESADFGFALVHRQKFRVAATLEMFIGQPSATVTPLKSV